MCLQLSTFVQKSTIWGIDVLVSVSVAHTYASRNGVPLEVISKVILRHSDLKTTQMYLGKVTDAEAIRWIDVLHSK
jgi:site-specific recombinase XerD